MAIQARPEGVAVVTGGAGGMGSATAREFVAEGWGELLLVDIDERRLEAVAGPLREAGATVAVLAGDIADPEFPDRIIAALGGKPIAAMVHTAGISPQMADAERILVVNLDATVRLVDAIHDSMAAGSAVVLFASNSAHMPMPPETAAAFWAPLPEGGALALAHLATEPNMAYPMSKIGVRALAKREAKRFGERGVRLLSLSPGAIDTPMGATEAAASPIVARMAAMSAIGRMGLADEVAAVAVFLCSPKAGLMAGVDVLVDGGQIAALGF